MNAKPIIRGALAIIITATALSQSTSQPARAQQYVVCAAHKTDCEPVTPLHKRVWLPLVFKK